MLCVHVSTRESKGQSERERDREAGSEGGGAGQGGGEGEYGYVSVWERERTDEGTHTNLINCS